MEVLDELNGALRDENDRNGLTKARMADRLGINRSEVTKLLNGRRRNMTMESIAALAWALDRDIDFHLIGETDDGRSNSAGGSGATARLVSYGDGPSSTGKTGPAAPKVASGLADWSRT